MTTAGSAAPRGRGGATSKSVHQWHDRNKLVRVRQTASRAATPLALTLRARLAASRSRRAASSSARHCLHTRAKQMAARATRAFESLRIRHLHHDNDVCGAEFVW